jgi:hypothetical protein
MDNRTRASAEWRAALFTWLYSTRSTAAFSRHDAVTPP